MSTKYLDAAKTQAALALWRFAATIPEQYREDFFHPCERDRWIPAFCEWWAADQAKMAEIRASND